jgi:hypothetical protein
MTDLAQYPRMAETTQTVPQNSGTLTLGPGAGPFTVAVKINNDGEIRYGQSGTDDYSSLEWARSKSVTGTATITFNFITGSAGNVISQMTSTSTLSFSAPSNNSQVCTVPNAANPTGYTFQVSYNPGGKTTNGVIIVSILPGDDDPA